MTVTVLLDFYSNISRSLRVGYRERIIPVGNDKTIAILTARVRWVAKDDGGKMGRKATAPDHLFIMAGAFIVKSLTY